MKKILLLLVSFSVCMNSIVAQSYVLQQLYASTGCTGTVSSTVVYPSGVCEVDATSSTSYTCTNNNPYENVYSTTNCAGTSTLSPLITQCQSGSSGSGVISCSSTIPVIANTATIYTYSSATCSSSSLQQVINYPLNTCKSDGSGGSQQYLCSGGQFTIATYTDTACQIAGGPKMTYPTTCLQGQIYSCSSPTPSPMPSTAKPKSSGGVIAGSFIGGLILGLAILALYHFYYVPRYILSKTDGVTIIKQTTSPIAHKVGVKV